MLQLTFQRTLAIIVGAGIYATGCASRGVPELAATPITPTLVVIVRHAEKSGPTGDVPLSAAGEMRAATLAQTLAGAHVAGVITTNVQRTRQTAAPTARAAGLTPIEVSPQSDVANHAAEIAGIIRARFAGRTVLVVGHSNTVSAIVRALGAAAPPDLCDSEYSHLFLVESFGGDSARVVDGRYGAPDPEVRTGCPAGR